MDTKKRYNACSMYHSVSRGKTNNNCAVCKQVRVLATQSGCGRGLNVGRALVRVAIGPLPTFY